MSTETELEIRNLGREITTMIRFRGVAGYVRTWKNVNDPSEYRACIEGWVLPKSWYVGASELEALTALYEDLPPGDKQEILHLRVKTWKSVKAFEAIVSLLTGAGMEVENLWDSKINVSLDKDWWLRANKKFSAHATLEAVIGHNVNPRLTEHTYGISTELKTVTDRCLTVQQTMNLLNQIQGCLRTLEFVESVVTHNFGGPVQCQQP